MHLVLRQCDMRESSSTYALVMTYWGRLSLHPLSSYHRIRLVSLVVLHLWPVAGIALEPSAEVARISSRQAVREALKDSVEAPEGALEGRFRISAMGPDGDQLYDAFIPAVAYNSVNHEYLVVWQGDDNTPPLVDDEHEIFGQRIDAATGAEVGVDDFRISDMGPDGDSAYDAERVAVAYNSVDNEYLVVWQGDDDTLPLVNNETEIFGQRIDAATGAEVGDNDFRISDMGPDGDSAHDAEWVALAYNSVDNEYLVVWQGDDGTPPLANGEFEIFGQRIDAATGAEVGDNDFRISDMGPDGLLLYDAFIPAVAYNSVNHEYLVVWHGDDNAAPVVDDEREIFGQRIDAATGVELGENDFRISDMGPDGDPDFDAVRPSVAHDSVGNQYLVVWEGDDSTPPLVDNEVEIFGQLIDGASGAETGDNDFRISSMGPDGNSIYSAESPSVVHNSVDRMWLVLWTGDDNTPPLVNNEREIYGQRISAVTGAELVGDDFRISAMGPDGNSGFDAFNPTIGYNSAENEFLFVWDGDDDVPPLVAGESEIFGIRWGLLIFRDGFELGDTSAWSDSLP